MICEKLYHIYVNNQCVRHNLDTEQFHREMQYIKAFLELTHLEDDAKIEYVQCDPPSTLLIDGSY